MHFSMALACLEIAFALFAGAHAILYKRDVRSSTFWLLLILLVPWLGILLYLLFGINRIRRNAPSVSASGKEKSPLIRPINHVTSLPTYSQCLTFKILQNGDQAYPQMLEAIHSAKVEILLGSYIFDNDTIGLSFVRALEKAVDRGVAVYVLLDGVGILYSIPSIATVLKHTKIPYAIFLPTLRPWSTRFLNLRNHRKILIIDRKQAFLGGMNLRNGHILSLKPPKPIVDIHFEVSGDVIQDAIQQFSQDWHYATGGQHPLRKITLPWQDAPAEGSPDGCAARIISDGPDLLFSRLASIVLIRISEAKNYIRIVTPYFLPDRIFIAALTTAALRGVRIEIVVPKNNNLPWMHWAMHSLSWQLLEFGIDILETRDHFDHSKIFIVDDHIVIVGSSNWDARSFRLNFELNLELHDSFIAKELNKIVDEKIARADKLTINQVESRSLPIRLRDGIARLFLPVL